VPQELRGQKEHLTHIHQHMLIWLLQNIARILITLKEVKLKNNYIMPTVKYKCPTSGKMKTKSFPYSATGKAQAASFANVTGGSMKNNPGYGMEKKSV